VAVRSRITRRRNVEREVAFDRDERERMRVVCCALGTTFEEFVRFAVLQALDECEAAADAWRRGIASP
jgi:hypothetical protein